ncbi:MAG: STAS domain-containing protein [Opitutaceae bacterium]|jgi:anti-anti-sigma factor
MNLQITTLPDSNTLCFAGDLDIYNVEAAREALLNHFADKPGLELDLAAVSTCDTAGMQLLMAARRSAVELGKSFVIHRPAPAVEKCGELLGLPPETRSPRAN